MSNALAIAAVTKTLFNLLDSEFTINPPSDPLTRVEVTMQPPDAANSETAPFQVNLFLYHVMPNAAWRNMPLPNQVLPGESGQPPLALNLYYMITAYARESSGTGDIDSHNLLGRVMRIDPATKPVAVKNADDTITVTLKSEQKVLLGQKASLLVNDQEIPSDPRVGDTNTLSFTGAIIQQSQTPVTYTLRLRVDGVDSIPFQRPINPPQPWDPYKNPPQFDKNQQVTL